MKIFREAAKVVLNDLYHELLHFWCDACWDGLCIVMRALDAIMKETIRDRALKINPIMAFAACPHDRKKKGEEKVKALS